MAGISTSGERPVVKSEPKRQVQAKEGRGRRGRKIKICKCPCSAGKEGCDTSLLQVLGAEAGFGSPVQVDCEHGGCPRAHTYCIKPNSAGGSWGSWRKGNNKVREVKSVDVDK